MMGGHLKEMEHLLDGKRFYSSDHLLILLYCYFTVVQTVWDIIVLSQTQIDLWHHLTLLETLLALIRCNFLYSYNYCKLLVCK